MEILSSAWREGQGRACPRLREELQLPPSLDDTIYVQRPREIHKIMHILYNHSKSFCRARQDYSKTELWQRIKPSQFQDFWQSHSDQDCVVWAGDTESTKQNQEPRTEPHKHAWVISDTGTKAIQWGRSTFSTNSARELYTDGQKNELVLSLICYIRINSRWIVGWRSKL